ncbi:MAG: alpha/beta fold hydrolase [Actinomycetota bacterium]|nr:alpha/beta fold hydrolase [Actinomycetota bacterium]
MTERATILGAEIAYEVIGDGLAFIWGHGLSQSRVAESVFGLIDFDRLPGQIVRYDARGHGESESTPDLPGYGWDQLALDQLALADHLGIDRYISAGASMGCGTALHAAVSAPNRVARCVLVIPPTAWETRATQAGEWQRIATMIEHDGVEPTIAARAAQPLPDPLADDAHVRDRQAAATRAWDPTRLAHVMRGAGHADFPTRDQVAAITAPTLILAWTGDPVHPDTTAHQLHELLPDSVLHVASTSSELSTWTSLVADFVSS